MSLIAQIIVNIPARSINKMFSYQIPEPLGNVGVGWRVLVPFGNRRLEGFIVEIIDAESSGLKSIIDILDEGPWFDQHMLTMARWISEHYLCSLAEAMRLFIPGKSGVKSKVLYRTAQWDDPNQAEAYLGKVSPSARLLYESILQQGAVSRTQLEKQFGPQTAKLVQQCLRHQLIRLDYATSQVMRPKLKTVIELAVPAETVEARLQASARYPAQCRLLTALLTKSQLGPDEVRNLGIGHDTVKRLVASGLVTTRQIQIRRDSYAGRRHCPADIVLTTEQKKVLADIIPYINKKQGQSFLLHGITGSGKTQVYIEAVAAVRQAQRQAIVLVPEIALTGQIISRFKARFGDDVVVMHSKLSVGERFDSWQRLRRQQAGIVIGARSAIFSPVVRLGIIIIDEEHEFTYKQEESPRYHTHQIALARAALEDAVVIFGSATPAVETYYHALRQEHKLLTLTARVDNALLPEVTVVDMREELRLGRRSVLSLPLQELLTQTVARREQAVILLNRRGYATFILCRECGHVIRCSHCAASLVYHHAGNLLRCHYCQVTQNVPNVCPKCGSHYIRYFGTGTQKVEEEMAKLFPAARIVRMDQDTTGGKMAHDTIMDDFARGKYDILLGTQMVAKGHDVKNVTAVGILSADAVLNLPDFRSAERTFSLLTQAAGRAGRGNKPGRVVVQAYNPEHYAVLAGLRQDYGLFYQEEIKNRQELNYPPFCRLVKIIVQDKNERKTRQTAERAAADLRGLLGGSHPGEVIGPFTAPVAKINDLYRVIILVKTTNLRAVRDSIRKLDWLNAKEILIDIDPLTTM
ncbi:dead/deah box helicase [Lucifera butyrica]|uniref:Replication restart protein PriA n=1 Tax=Lucifera butyrica TaxID=1351585 RepID=A0A498RAP0_9FIRM|nr:primosomal protein N' [Lucifera butyrica]VBB07947.1 dead/deah box helicase [Lucifera butyrica]